ncbi:hypothetical protein Btru_040557 [Bulinus truncatus]|nr:hypothetical protein Btru_040557 [Bulinus truncatus]
MPHVCTSYTSVSLDTGQCPMFVYHTLLSVGLDTGRCPMFVHHTLLSIGLDTGRCPMFVHHTLLSVGLDTGRCPMFVHLTLPLDIGRWRVDDARAGRNNRSREDRSCVTADRDGNLPDRWLDTSLGSALACGDKFRQE